MAYSQTGASESEYGYGKNNPIKVHKNIVTALDISTKAVNAYWRRRDPRLSNILMVMDSSEDWVIDDKNIEIEKRLLEFCQEVDEKGSHNNINNMSRDLLYILAYLHSTRAIRFIEWLDTRFQGMGLRIVQKAAQVIKQSEENELNGLDIESQFIESKLLVDRINTLKRVNHLSRVFSPSRMRMVVKAVESIEKI